MLIKQLDVQESTESLFVHQGEINWKYNFDGLNKINYIQNTTISKCLETRRWKCVGRRFRNPYQKYEGY